MIATAVPVPQFETPATYDRQVCQLAAAALSTSKYAAIRQLSCQVFEGVVEITGTVPSFYLKQLAQAAVLQLHGAGGVRNLVQVSGEPQLLVAKTCVPAGSG